MGERLRFRITAPVVIVGTAGHVDHGKTALVRALTGIDTDRLPEERRRGMSIDLGFAPLSLPGVGQISIVDVPGHQAFVHTMVAGAAGIDAAILVVAADEGVMPQTREHLRILSALGVTETVVALTKADLVDSDWLALVAGEVAATLEECAVRATTIIPVSSLTGVGLDSLRSELVILAGRAQPRSDTDLFRLVVDRSFTLIGVGTVVTGTVWSGAISSPSTVTILPATTRCRVRGIHSHGAPVSRAAPGARIALALADVTPTQVERGCTIVADEGWTASTQLFVRFETQRNAPRGGVGSFMLPRRFRLHLAGAEIAARVAQTSAVTPDEAFDGRVVLERPVVARRGDRFVVRAADAGDTICGGIVLDPSPERGSRGAWSTAGNDPAERLVALLAATHSAGVQAVQLPVRLGVHPHCVASLIEQVGGVALGTRVFARAAIDTALASAAEVVLHDHAIRPLARGVPLAELRSSLRAAAELSDHVMGLLANHPDFEIRDGFAAPRGDSTLADPEQQLLARLVHRVLIGGTEPPSVAELSVEFGKQTEALLRFAGRNGSLIRVESVRWYAAEVVQSMIGRLVHEMEPGREYSPSELRVILGVSRKYLIPFLEYCDDTGVTERRSGGRALFSVSSR